ncbi:large ribosomal subunit protein bL35m [Achroia grisella]|uniref:large ribosomal subunit protein bL35m n=1 Tax=Achroia grisella TaxID=688607 RepID=UPI0027D2B81B|nr:large ribosomal subunit protein bL35m [Achroia grisella]
MFRSVFCVVRNIRPLTIPYCNTASIIANNFRNLCTTNKINLTPQLPSLNITSGHLSSNQHVLTICSNMIIPTRSVTKFSLKKGKRKTVKAVIHRFFRLHWGGWIRTKAGRKKRLWKKSSAQKRRLRQHVLCNATQNTLLDKMVTKFWKRPKYYVDDPYTPYHSREEYAFTRKKPLIRD